MELELERAVGYAPTALEHGHRLVEDLLKVHRRPSLCSAACREPCGGEEIPSGGMYTTADWERKAGSGGTHCEEGAKQRGVAPAPTRDASRQSSLCAPASQ